MAKYKLTNKAVDDLTRIWNYTIDKWSENQAEKYYFMLLENCNEVARNPELGKNYSEVSENLWGFKRVDTSFFTERLKKTKWKSREYCMNKWI
jgi:toxin ParE1/3/4